MASHASARPKKLALRELTDGNSCCCDTLCDAPLFGKAQPDQSKAGYVQEACTKTNAYSLRQKDLVVLLRQTEHEETKDDKEVAEEQHDTKVSKVEQRARQAAHRNEKE